MNKFYEYGTQKDEIEVIISYRIIHLFSEGLYTSPNKAIEELVCNSFDADAQHVHVLLSPDLQAEGASIVIIDDGEGMDKDGFTQHWIIGKSVRPTRISSKKRNQIGKFGIGKLATYVLANRLTHICKKDGNYFSTTMDYKSVPSDTNSGVFEEDSAKKKVKLPFNELTEEQAKNALAPWLKGTKKGYKALKLFGDKASSSWTVAIMSELKNDMIDNLKVGRLKWVLSTAMPLRDDFILYLNGDQILSSKESKESKTWIIGKDITEKELGKTGLDDLSVTIDEGVSEKSETRYGLFESSIGRITGKIELYEDGLDVGKSAEIMGRSNGFFVYVRGRLINEDDGHFGIGSNKLSHGTFSRFRGIIYADKLDDELRSSRESVRSGSLVNSIRNILMALFNVARKEWKKKEDELTPGAKFSRTIKATPYSLTQKPILSLLRKALNKKAFPKYLKYDTGLESSQIKSYMEKLEQRITDQDGLIQGTELIELSQDERITVLNIETGKLEINTMHPFVAHFLDEYEDVKKNLPLELFAMSEVLLETNLYQAEISENDIAAIMDLRDELLRTLAKSTRKRNSLLVSQALIDASTDKVELESEIVAVFDNMGFDAVPLGGKGKPDGTASAILGVDEQGKPQKYKVSLEAKSKETLDATVANSSVMVSTIARLRDKYECDHAIVVGPDFPSDGTALSKEVQADREKEKESGKTITIMRIYDLARLVRLRPLKKIGPKEIRELFIKCEMPEDCKKWVDALEATKIEKPNYQVVLEVIWEIQQKRFDEVVDLGAISQALEHTRGIKYSRVKIGSICKSLEGMAPECITVRTNNIIDLVQRPDIVLQRIKAETEKYPEGERKESFIKGL